MDALVRRSVTLFAIVLSACQAAPLPSPSPVTPPATMARPQVERVWIDDPQLRLYASNEMIVDGDRELTVGVDFAEPPRREDVEPALRGGVPPGSIVEWPTDRRMTVRVPAGGPFDVDLSGADPAPNSNLSLPTSLRFHVDRPTYEVALFRPADALAGSLTPARTWTVHLAVQYLRSFAADGHRVLVYHGITPRRTDYSLLDLDSGQKSSLSAPFMEMASSGSSLMDWLPNGRLLGVAHATSFVGDGDGQRPEKLPGLLGQGAVLSPSGRLVALWSYAESTAAILDLETGTLLPLPGAFPRCTVGGIVGLSWVDDERLAISDCTVDLEGTPRTRVLNVRTGATLETRLGDQLVMTLAGGVEMRARVEPAHAMSSPKVEQWLADRTGRVIAKLPAAQRYLTSPDGTALAYADPDRQRSVLIDAATGTQTEIIGEAMTWTKRGELAVVRRSP